MDGAPPGLPRVSTYKVRHGEFNSDSLRRRYCWLTVLFGQYNASKKIEIRGRHRRRRRQDKKSFRLSAELTVSYMWKGGVMEYEYLSHNQKANQP